MRSFPAFALLAVVNPTTAAPDTIELETTFRIRFGPSGIMGVFDTRVIGLSPETGSIGLSPETDLWAGFYSDRYVGGLLEPGHGSWLGHERAMGGDVVVADAIYPVDPVLSTLGGWLGPTLRAGRAAWSGIRAARRARRGAQVTATAKNLTPTATASKVTAPATAKKALVSACVVLAVGTTTVETVASGSGPPLPRQFVDYQRARDALRRRATAQAKTRSTPCK